MNGNDRLREALQNIRGISATDHDAFGKVQRIAYAALLAQEGAAAPEGEGLVDAEVDDVLRVLDGWGLILRDPVGKKPAMALSDVAALIRRLREPTR